MAGGARAKTTHLLARITQWNEEFTEEKRRVLHEEFQIWAARGVETLLTDADVRAFDRWVVNYADAFLQMQADQMLAYQLPVHLIEGQLRPLRADLTALVLHIKAEARKACTFREKERSEAVGERLRAPEALASGPQQPLTRRAECLTEALQKRSWTTKELERQGGPDAKTTRKILAGEPVRETVLEKLAQVLSFKESVKRKDIPD